MYIHMNLKSSLHLQSTKSMLTTMRLKKWASSATGWAADEHPGPIMP